MFLVERQIWAIPQTEEGKADFDKIKKRIGRDEQKARQGLKSDMDGLMRRDQSVSRTPDGGHSVYAFNDTFIELRTPFDEMRGGITFAAACFLVPMVVGALPFPSMAREMMTGMTSSGEPLPWQGYAAYAFSILLILGVVGVAFYFGWRILRLESFVQRRLLVRFNRKTRKVYVHRPVYAGGVVELPWDEVRPDGVHPGSNEAGGVGASLMLMWTPQHTPNHEIELVLVGRRARGNAEITDLWEFIRRYMEEGPQSVPRPRLIGKFPWPWKALQAAAALVWPLWRIGSLRWMLPLLLLVSPAIALFAAGHWLSLLSCWEPVWPRAIRQACGEGWGSVLRNRFIDLGAWGMAGGVIALVVLRAGA
jgi:hypothetical protein